MATNLLVTRKRQAIFEHPVAAPKRERCHPTELAAAQTRTEGRRGKDSEEQRRDAPGR